MRALGDLSASDAGDPVWTAQINGASVRIALAQFRDNIMIASSATRAKHLVMGKVCRALSTAWNLPVVCECKDVCSGACMSNCITAVGVGFSLPQAQGTPLVHLHPSTLNDRWELKWSPPLQTPGGSTPDYLHTLFIGVMQSNLNLVRSWAGLLLSAVAWMQVAVLSGFAAKDIIRPMSEAINRACARTAHNHEPSKRWVGFIARKLPVPKHQAMLILHQWLVKHAFWDGLAYTSWHVPHGRDTPHSESCGSWCFDSPNLVDFLSC